MTPKFQKDRKNYKTIKIAHWASSGCGPGAHQAYWAPRAPRAYWAPQAHRAHRAHRACWAHPGRPSGGMCGWTHSTGHFFLHTSAAKSHEISGLRICMPLLSLVKRKGPACTQKQKNFCAPCKRSPELVTPDLARCSRWRLRGTPAPDAIVRTSGEPPIPAGTLCTVREKIKSTLPYHNELCDRT